MDNKEFSKVLEKRTKEFALSRVCLESQIPQLKKFG